MAVNSLTVAFIETNFVCVIDKVKIIQLFFSNIRRRLNSGLRVDYTEDTEHGATQDVIHGVRKAVRVHDRAPRLGGALLRDIPHSARQSQDRERTFHVGHTTTTSRLPQVFHLRPSQRPRSMENLIYTHLIIEAKRQ